MDTERMQEVYVEQLVYERELLRTNKEYSKADDLRSFLETAGVFIEDGKRVVYLPQTVTVEQFKIQEEKERTSEKRFDMWLNSMLEKIKNENQSNKGQ